MLHTPLLIIQVHVFGCADLFPIARDADASGFLSLAQHYLAMYLVADLVNCALIRCVRSRYWQCCFGGCLVVIQLEGNCVFLIVGWDLRSNWQYTIDELLCAQYCKFSVPDIHQR